MASDFVAADAATCCVTIARNDAPLALCGKVAVRRHPNAYGAYWHLCLAHSKDFGVDTEPCYTGEAA